VDFFNLLHWDYCGVVIDVMPTWDLRQLLEGAFGVPIVGQS
jgi:hypothetical protein